MSRDKDEHYMRAAIEEAKRSEGRQLPNPMVGALIVEDERVVARGFHAKCGEAHAEINALNDLGRKPKKGATMYVTLEPCSTIGRTGACTKALTDSGISAVVVGAIDPNPQHKGRGIQILKKAGVQVRTGVLEEECAALNPEFNQLQRAKVRSGVVPHKNCGTKTDEAMRTKEDHEQEQQ